MVNEPQALTRNGFVTFWLWMCAIAGVLVPLECIALLTLNYEIILLGDTTPYVVVLWLALSTICVIAYFMLLKWRKKGFRLLLAVGCVEAVSMALLAVEFMVPTMLVIGVSISLVLTALLFPVLRIRSNGVSYWDAMELYSEYGCPNK